MTWDRREYERQHQRYVTERGARHPMPTAATLILAGTWLAGWGASAALLHAGIASMGLRYALAWAVAYGAFFIGVRIWCNSAHHDRRDATARIGSGLADAGSEGCLVMLALWAGAAAIAGLFWASGGFTALLDAAFEVAFAGTLVRRLAHTDIVGGWARSLLANTWPQALAALLVLSATAHALQRQVPGATRFSEAVGALWERRSPAP